MKNFFEQYYNNIINAIENREMNFSDVQLNCNFCPYAKQCGEAADNGDNRPCAQFILATIKAEG